MSELACAERLPADQAEGLLVLHHGRGTSEHDLIGLADVLDPQQRLHVVSPRGPFEFAGSPGYHWYVVERVGFPHRDSFMAGLTALADFHDSLWQRTGIGPERTILGGFSQGAVMSFATGLGPGRPVPAGVLGLSGFIPTVEGWEPDFAGRPELPVFISHGVHDQVIPFAFAERARDQIEAAGLPLDFHPAEVAHGISPAQVPAMTDWIDRTLA